MKEETRAFQTIPVVDQNRFEDRISFLYLERSKLVQSESGVVAWASDESEAVRSELQLPVAGLALLSLGPGTSITNAALASCARSGCVVQFTNGGAFPELSTIVPLTTSAKWALAQAKVVTDNTLAKEVAKAFYKKQFGLDSFTGSITQMRGVEGSLVRKLYQSEARKHRVGSWHRATEADDNVNVALNISNSILYGVMACLVGALAMNPALGVIHRGNAKAFLFDLADLYKPTVSIPVAFSMAHERQEDVPRLVRAKLREAFVARKLMRDVILFLTETFTPYLPEQEGDRLIGTSHEVEAHRNYGSGRANGQADAILGEL